MTKEKYVYVPSDKVVEEQKEVEYKFPLQFSRWIYPSGETKIKQWIGEQDYEHALMLGIKIVPVLTKEG